MIPHETLSTLPDPTFRQLCEQVVADMARLPIPGVALGVLIGDQEYAAGFGITSVENPLPVTPDTLFQIGSITKTFVATAAMRLVEAGKLDLDVPLRTWLPDLRLSDEAVAQRVSLRHLLTHTGGWVGDYFNDFGSGDDALARMVAKVAELPQLTPLGEAFSYNNAGFYLAGRVLEVVTGTPFEQAIKELVLTPLDMSHTFFSPEEVMTYRFVVGHEAVEKQPNVAHPWPIGRAVHAAGGLVSTVHELFRYARFLMGNGITADGTRLLGPQSMAVMYTPQVPASGVQHVGLSWFITSLDGSRMISHGGGTNGQVTHLAIVPDREFAVVILTNGDQGGTLIYPLLDRALSLYLDLGLPKATPIDVAQDQLPAFAGRYESALSGADITLGEGVLVLQAFDKGGFPTPDTPPGPPPPPVRLAFYAEDRVVGLDEPFKDARGEFLRDPDGRIAWLRVSGRLHRRVDGA